MAGAISVRYEVVPGTADTTDVVTAAGTLTWADGDTSAHTIRLAPVDDMLLEGEERFQIRLRDPTGGAGIGIAEIDVTIEDDEALRGLQFVPPVLQITAGESTDVTIAPHAAAPGPIVVHYFIATALDSDGAPTPTRLRRRASTGTETLSASCGGTAATRRAARFQ